MIIKPHNRCFQTFRPHPEPVNMFGAKEKGFMRSHAPVCITAYSFPSFPLWSALFEVPQECPLPRTIITLVCDPLSSRQRDEFTSWECGDPNIIFLRTNTWCFSLLHPFTLSDWCWQFPQMKLCHSETWSMALISQILTSIRPRSNLFLPTTKHFWCRTAHTHTQLQRKTTFVQETLCCFIRFSNPFRCPICILGKKKS